MGNDLLTHLRNDAVEAWCEVLNLQDAKLSGQATPEQLDIALKFAVTAQANYTIAAHKQVMEEEGAG